MNAGIVKINGGTAMKCIDFTVKVKVTQMKTVRARIWLGCMVMRFGAWVIGVGRCEIIEK